MSYIVAIFIALCAEETAEPQLPMVQPQPQPQHQHPADQHGGAGGGWVGGRLGGDLGETWALRSWHTLMA